jgi:hypothetical protein
MFDFVAGRRPLSTSYIKELHAALLRNLPTHTVVDQFGNAFERPLEKGAYKTTVNSPTRPDGFIHEYAPPEHVASEMDELVRMHTGHQAQQVPVEVEAAWLHHRFTQIHPFSDGNGRVARALASLVFIRAGWFPVVIRRDDRARYIEALEKADAGNPRLLVALFVESQRTALIQASEIAYDVRPITSTHDAVIAARDRLIQRGRLPLKDWVRVKDTAFQLWRIAGKRLEIVSRELNSEIGNLSPGFSFSPESGSQEGINEWRELGVRESGQVPEFREFNARSGLMLNTGRNEALEISFHAIGPHFRGFVGAVGYLLIRGSQTVVHLKASAFQTNYEEDLETAKTRFSAWLDNIIVRGLDEWRRAL